MPEKRILEDALGSYQAPPGMGVDDLIEDALDKRSEEIKNISSKQGEYEVKNYNK